MIPSAITTQRSDEMNARNLTDQVRHLFSCPIKPVNRMCKQAVRIAHLSGVSQRTLQRNISEGNWESKHFIFHATSHLSSVKVFYNTLFRVLTALVRGSKQSNALARPETILSTSRGCDECSGCRRKHFSRKGSPSPVDSDSADLRSVLFRRSVRHNKKRP